MRDPLQDRKGLYKRTFNLVIDFLKPPREIGNIYDCVQVKMQNISL